MAVSESPRLASLFFLLPLFLVYHVKEGTENAFVPFRSSSTRPLIPVSDSTIKGRPYFNELGEQVLHRIHTLANISMHDTSINRPYLSTASFEAQLQILKWMKQANLDATIDVLGNVVGMKKCAGNTTGILNQRKVLLLGSHHDTVPNAGMFDGVLGIVSGIAVADLMGDICDWPFDIGVIAFDDEEGNNNIGTTNLGAKAICDVDIPNKDPLLNAYKKAHGTKLTEEMLSSVPIRDELLGFIELHLEQGPVLEATGRPVGVVDAIAGQTRLKVSLSGESGHAGTVPMHLRRDALAAAIEGVAAVEKVKQGVLATVGQLKIDSGAGNVIPSKVELLVDIRSSNDRLRKQHVQKVVHTFKTAARKRGVEVEIEKYHEVAAVRMAEWMTRVMQDTTDCVNGIMGDVTSWETLTSGAGHDSMIMAEVTDVAMLFVRCRDGLSHHPDEFVSLLDVYAGGRALLASVHGIRKRVELDRL